MRTYEFTCIAASYCSPLGQFVRGMKILVHGDGDPRLVQLRASRAFSEKAIEGGPAVSPAPAVQVEATAPTPVAAKVTPLSALGDKRLAATLADGGITSIEEIVKLGQNGLIHIHGIGEVLARKILSLANMALADRTELMPKRSKKK